MGLLLYWISILLSLLIKPFATLFTIYEYFHKVRSWYDLKIAWRNYCSHYLIVAYCNDTFANVWGKHFFNRTMIKKDGYKFGNRKETLSSVYGKNQLLQRLRDLGAFIVKVLDKLDRNHSINSIDETI